MVSRFRDVVTPGVKVPQAGSAWATSSGRRQVECIVVILFSYGYLELEDTLSGEGNSKGIHHGDRGVGRSAAQNKRNECGKTVDRESIVRGTS